MNLNKFILIVLFVLALIGGYLFFSQYIGLVAVNEVVKQDWADLDAQLRSRSFLIPDLISAVRECAPEEEDVFTGIADAGSKLDAASTPAAKAEADEALTDALGRLLVIAASCPELNTDENFIRLQVELADAERRIAAASRKYNENVEIYNICTDGFFIAGHIGYVPREKFEPPRPSAETHGEAEHGEAEHGEAEAGE